MEFWLLMLTFNMLIPVAMVLQGLLFLKKPPTEINWKYGYKTKLSMKNRQMWVFAQKHYGSLLCRWGSALNILTIFLMLLCREKGRDFIEGVSGILCVAQIVVYVVAQTPTDRVLRIAFDEHGVRKQITKGEAITQKEWRKVLYNHSGHDILCMK